MDTTPQTFSQLSYKSIKYRLVDSGHHSAIKNQIKYQSGGIEVASKNA